MHTCRQHHPPRQEQPQHRHSAISLLLAAGVPVVAVAGVMGHDPVITQRIYAHLFDDDARDAMTTLDHVLRNL